MYRTGEHSKQNYSSSSTAAHDKLKQKKRLSFREPEVETPHNSSWSNSNRIQSKPSALLAPTVDGPKQSSSLEDLTLEDQTFIIAKHVGQAFDKRPYERTRLSTSSVPKTTCSDSRAIQQSSSHLSETLQNDCSRIGNALQKNGSNSRAILAPEDAQYFEALSPPILNMSTMKFPAIEESDCIVAKPNQALVASTDIVPTTVQHQMQFLKYQLEQQRQQTQAAIAHIQLLKDQLQAETSARFKAQTQNHQLIMQNKELLDHIQSLFRQIQDLEKLTEKHERKPTFPSSSQEQQQETPQITEAATTNAVTAPKKNGQSQASKTSVFAPNPIMASRRSSMASLKPFQSKTSYLEPNSKFSEARISSRGSSPTPTGQIRNPLPNESSADTTKTNNSNGGRSFLFNSTQRYDAIKNNPTKGRQEDVKDNSTKEWQNVTNTSTKDTAKSNTKSLTNSESNFRDENLVLNENPFFIEEKSPRKLEGYAPRKNHSSDPTPDYTSVSSVALTPRSHTNWSKSSKLHNNDNGVPLGFDNSTANLRIKENKRFPSGTPRLFNS